jgi:hypothetical protein
MTAWVGAGALAFGIAIGSVTVHVATAQPVGCRAVVQRRRSSGPRSTSAVRAQEDPSANSNGNFFCVMRSRRVFPTG